jgi:hypothetical protein
LKYHIATAEQCKKRLHPWKKKIIHPPPAIRKAISTISPVSNSNNAKDAFETLDPREYRYSPPIIIAPIVDNIKRA